MIDNPPGRAKDREKGFPMMKLYFEALREGYGPDQIRRTMTVGELIDFLSQYDEDTPIYTTHDNRYTYGGIREDMFTEVYPGEDENDEEEDEE